MQSFNDDRAAPPYSGPASGSTQAEQDNRPLPEGWTRQWDPNYKQYFFVDTKANPPRSSWVHPLDDVQSHKTHGPPADNLTHRPPADSDSESTDSSSSSSPSKRDMKRAKRAEKRAHREEKREERKEDKHARKEEKRARKHEKRI